MKAFDGGTDVDQPNAVRHAYDEEVAAKRLSPFQLLCRRWSIRVSLIAVIHSWGESHDDRRYLTPRRAPNP
jgi:steroid 5-alpha reductase family enzyme